MAQGQGSNQQELSLSQSKVEFERSNCFTMFSFFKDKEVWQAIFSEKGVYMSSAYFQAWKGLSLPPLPEQDAGKTALTGAMMRASGSGVQVDQCTGPESRLWCRVTSRDNTSQCFPNYLALTSLPPPLPLYSLKLGM